jgi:diguanylate cyclase (GGDEF)-like protein
MTRRPGLTAVLFLDLDRFKVINDSMSHEAGDRLLIKVSKRLRGCIRPMDTIARLGGDEFVILFEDLAAVDGALLVADRIQKSLEEPFFIESQEVYTSCSMGLAVAETFEAQPSDLVRDAEVAMYRAKSKGEGQMEIFDPSMNARAMERLRMESEMRQALDRGEFLLNYQPLINLGGGMIEGWEALVRWKHPERGMVSPGDFIPLAEETGIIVPLGQWVLEEACRQTHAWNLERTPEDILTMNVNLSARQFQQRGLVAQVQDTLRDLRVDPLHLKLEITESVMMRDPGATRDTLMGFKELGVRLAIDDFGTGYSSLAYLKRFPVDTLKIDKAFIDGLGKDPEDTAIVEAIISLAKALGIRVTAEGIETRDQYLHLCRLGCDQGQGYYFSRPLPSEAANALLLQDPRW